MSLHTNIKAEIKTATLGRDALRLSVVRSLVAAFTNELVVKQRKPTGELSDEEALSVIRRAVKQRKESIEQFKAGGRQDLVDAEAAELSVLEKYLPQMMSRDEIKKVAEAKKKELGITDKTKLGQFVGMLMMKELKGRADGTDVKIVAEELLK